MLVWMSKQKPYRTDVIAFTSEIELWKHSSMKLEQMKFNIQILELVVSLKKHFFRPQDYFWKHTLQYLEDL